MIAMVQTLLRRERSSCCSLSTRYSIKQCRRSRGGVNVGDATMVATSMIVNTKFMKSVLLVLPLLLSIQIFVEGKPSSRSINHRSTNMPARSSYLSSSPSSSTDTDDASYEYDSWDDQSVGVDSSIVWGDEDEGEYDKSFHDTSLLDDEAEAILEALERSEQRRRKRSTKRKQTKRKNKNGSNKLSPSSSSSRKSVPATRNLEKTFKHRSIRTPQNKRNKKPPRHPKSSMTRAAQRYSDDKTTSSSVLDLPSSTDSKTLLSSDKLTTAKKAKPMVHRLPRTKEIPLRSSTAAAAAAADIQPQQRKAKSLSSTGQTTATSTSTTTPWIRRFLQQRPDDSLLCIPKDFIADNFNLSQLSPIIERIGYHRMGPKRSSEVSKALGARRQELRASAAAAAATNRDSSNGGGAVPPTSVTSGVSMSPPSQTISPSLSTTSIFASQYPIYKSALKLILSDEDYYGDEDTTEELMDTIGEGMIPIESIEVAAEALYLFLHARFITSPRGLETVRQLMMKDRTRFGKCPRPACCGTGTVPYGYSNSYTTPVLISSPTSATTNDNNDNSNIQNGSSPSSSSSSSPTTKCHRYCPSCGEVWMVWDSVTDGCAWGPSFCHLLLLAHGSQIFEAELKAIAESNKQQHSMDVRTHPRDVVSARTSTQPPATTYHHQQRPPPFSPKKLYEYFSTGTTTNSISDMTTAASSSGANKSLYVSDSNPVIQPQQSQSPPPSIYGFQIHPETTFGRPWREDHHGQQQQQQQQQQQRHSTLNARGGGGGDDQYK